MVQTRRLETGSSENTTGETSTDLKTDRCPLVGRDNRHKPCKGVPYKVVTVERCGTPYKDQYKIDVCQVHYNLLLVQRQMRINREKAFHYGDPHRNRMPTVLLDTGEHIVRVQLAEWPM